MRTLDVSVPSKASDLCLCRRAIRAAFKNRQRGAVLTTHYMEEAEAVCDRVAIMVSGQLRSALTAACLSLKGLVQVSGSLKAPSVFQVYRLHPTFKGEVRSRLQFGGETPRGADGAPAGGAAAQRDPPHLPSRRPAGEVRPSPIKGVSEYK